MKTSNHHYDFIYKILLLGDSSVGKTCLLLRYSDDTFSDNHISTIGLDYRLKLISLENSKVAKIQIWDTAGQDRFKSITKNYYKGAHGIILLYDVTSENSFVNIRNWINQIKENATEAVKIVLIGNKIDDEPARKVSKQEGEKIAKENAIQFFETSAKMNIGVKEVFDYMTNEIYLLSNQEEGKKTNVMLDKGKKEKKKGCCKDS